MTIASHNKRGRRPAEDPRRHAVTCRLTDSELERCDANRGELTRGEWLRIGALDSLPVVVPALNREAYAELAKAAGNMNQLARKLNSGDLVELDQVRAELAAFRLALIGART